MACTVSLPLCLHVASRMDFTRTIDGFDPKLNGSKNYLSTESQTSETQIHTEYHSFCAISYSGEFNTRHQGATFLSCRVHDVTESEFCGGIEFCLYP